MDGPGYEQLINLDQWKQARRFHGYSENLIIPIEHFFHFKRFAVCLKIFTEGDAMKIRNVSVLIM